MPLPWPKFTLRRLMACVAVAAVILAAAEMARRAVRYNQLALFHAREHSNLTTQIRNLDENARSLARNFGIPNRSALSPERVALVARSAHHNHLWAKYFKAARRPWLPVEPDPPVRGGGHR